MICPKCENSDFQVIDSRDTNEGLIRRRRRFCPRCNNRITTYEIQEKDYKNLKNNELLIILEKVILKMLSIVRRE